MAVVMEDAVGGSVGSGLMVPDTTLELNDIVVTIHIQHGVRAVMIGTNLGSGRPAVPFVVEGHWPVAVLQEKLASLIMAAHRHHSF